MHTRIHYLRLLDEVNQLFDDPDWETIRKWIEEEAHKDRVREGRFVPATVKELLSDSVPALNPGDIVLNPIYVRADHYVVPPACYLQSSLYSSGAVDIGEGVQIVEDVVAGQQIQWTAGEAGSARNLIAPSIQIETGGVIHGGIWCDRIASGTEGISLAPDTVVRGIVIVDAPEDGKVVIGAGCQLGGLYVRGSVETMEGVTISHLQATGSATIGRHNRIGYLQGETVMVNANSTIAVLESQSDVELKKEVVVDTVQATGNVKLHRDIRVTGNLLLLRQGELQVPEGDSWYSQRQHWFFLLPGEEILPYSKNERPKGSSLLVLRTLTNQLWTQVEQLSGRLPHGSL